MAKVSEQVASHTSGFPADHGMTDTPSGRLPSALERPGGSSREGILAEERARWMMSFKAACLDNLPLLYLQLKPCLPVESTSCPQLQHW